MNALRVVKVAGVVLGAGAAITACGSTNAAPPTRATAAVATTTTAPSTVVPQTSLAAFEAQLKHKLLAPQPAGFAVSGVDTVQCSLPRAWIPGKVFNCYSYDVHGSEIGDLQITVESTQPGQAWDANLDWQPSAAYAGNSGTSG